MNGLDYEEAQRIAHTFVDARQSSQIIAEYPGTKPDDLTAAYHIQDCAIELWPDAIGGWKVGQIKGAKADELGATRLMGPIFHDSIKTAQKASVPMPIFGGGFAAVEAEIVFVLGEDAPADKAEWSLDEARAMIARTHAGVEIASSPYAAINKDGPLVTISDFGNNRGLILGDVLPTTSSSDWCDIECVTEIDGTEVGKATPRSIVGGPLESLRQVLENTAARGMSLRKGMLVSSGAVTGVHAVNCGQIAAIHIAGVSKIICRLFDSGIPVTSK